MTSRDMRKHDKASRERIFGGQFIREREFVESMLRRMPKSPGAIIGNGDDAALLRSHHRGTLVATDMLLDGTHFIAATTAPELMGRKAAAVNLSDIAAMGGVPESLFVSLAIPRGTSGGWCDRVMAGIAEIAREFNCGVDGGDTNVWQGPFAINVCVTGHPHWRGAVTRSGARAGDVVMVSGKTLGGSLRSGRHLTFTPRVKEARWLLDQAEIHSMMDLSDGLATDIKRLAAASQKQIILNARQITNQIANKIVSGDENGTSFSEAELTSALCDGEDFELLFTCDETAAADLEASCPWPCGVRRVGEVKAGHGVFITRPGSRDLQPLTATGYEHG